MQQMIFSLHDTRSATDVRRLLERDADINELKDEVTPLGRAVLYGRADVVDVLLECGSE